MKCETHEDARRADEAEVFTSVAKKAAGSLKAAVATLVALVPLAYIAGYFYSQGYCRSVGASWLVQMLEPQLMLTFGIVPVVLVGLLSWIVVPAVEGAEGDPPVFRALRPRTVLRLLFLAIAAAVAVMLFRLPVNAALMSAGVWLVIYALLFFAMWELWYLLVDLRTGRWRGTYGDYFPLFFFVLNTLVLFPWLKGVADGSLAASTTHSHLARPQIRSDAECEDPRLLFVAGKVAVILCLGQDGEARRTILVVDLKNVGPIHSPGR